MHWINDKTFFYYVCKSAGLKKELDLQRFCSISAGFINVEQAKKYAKSIADGLNFVIIYGASGEAMHTYSPSYDWNKNQD